MKKYNIMGITIGVVAMFLFVSGCSIRKPVTAITADISARGMVAMERESDLFVAKESILPLVKIVEVLHYGYPTDRKFLGVLAKTYGNYAFGFAEVEAIRDSNKSGGDIRENEWYKRAKRFYRKGKDFGLKSLSKKGNLDKISLNKFQKKIKRYGKKWTDTLFWTAFDWGSLINMSRDDILEASNLPRVQAMVDRVIELDPEFQCGVAYAFKGAMIASNFVKLSADSGREEARSYFKKAMNSCDGNYLMNKVMYAEWYLAAVGNHALFRDTLNSVLSADASLLPEQRLANEIAKERATLLLAQKDEQ